MFHSVCFQTLTVRLRQLLIHGGEKCCEPQSSWHTSSSCCFVCDMQTVMFKSFIVCFNNSKISAVKDCNGPV